MIEKTVRKERDNKIEEKINKEDTVIKRKRGRPCIDTKIRNEDEIKSESENDRLNNQQQQKCKKRPWSIEEDRLVIQLVDENGPQKWTVIANKLPGRIGKQCRERWHNHLNPNIKKYSWSNEEEWILFLQHCVYGNQWAIISKNIKGRTDNNIKNHWNIQLDFEVGFVFQQVRSLFRT